MKVILDEKLYDDIWNRIEKEYKFYPSVNKKINAFEFSIENICYQLNCCWSAEQEEIVNDIFKKLSNDDLYALDWQHDCFGYNPNENIELGYHYYDKDRKVEVYFPSYYPNGDYHMFLSKDWSYGMFGHPWKNEIYIFGKKTINEFKNKEKELNITKL